MHIECYFLLKHSIYVRCIVIFIQPPNKINRMITIFLYSLLRMQCDSILYPRLSIWMLNYKIALQSHRTRHKHKQCKKLKQLLFLLRKSCIPELKNFPLTITQYLTFQHCYSYYHCSGVWWFVPYYTVFSFRILD